jgi:hypothetical protein
MRFLVRRPVLNVTLVLSILGGIGGFGGHGSYSPIHTKMRQEKQEQRIIEYHPHHSILSSYLIYPIRGGAII